MPEITPPQPNTPERSSPPKPTLPLDVRVAIAETERKVRRLLEDCPTIPYPTTPVLLESDQATEAMRAGVSEAFNPRMEYYALQPGFCQAWLDEAADETVAATVNLAPPWTRSHYRGGAH
jgi:hypothetical protein